MATVINGTSGNDTLTGTAYDDLIYGLAGNDTLSGLAGNDMLDGGTGVDTMLGGLGDDVYVVDNAGDVVTENAGEGADTVISSADNLSYTLGANVENLTLTGTNVTGIGNDLNNVLTSSSYFSANDVLNGGAGADTMSGNWGNDTYYVDNAGDVVIESAGDNTGTDTVISSVSYTLGANVENLTLAGADNINATGNALNNILKGNAANNILTGGAGSDIFVFNTALGLTNVDTIADYTSGSDSMQLALSMFSGIGATGALSATAFVSGAGLTAATTATEHIVYDTTAGMLYYDVDGAGGAASVAFATLTGAPTLSVADFAVV